MSKDFLLEIGVEELPPSWITPGLRQLQETLAQKLADDRIRHEQMQTLGTMRRLTIWVRDLADRQADAATVVQGPKVEAAYDGQGKPTKAAIGFARAQGVPLEDLEKKETPKGMRVVAVRTEKGQATKKRLQDIVSGAIRSLSFPKSMR